ncbi:uncharacterized protein LOC128194717 isoform X2 [Vigna angularis]|uniref:uncharacterized protein LOC128194717 isoform X2 n=1 Tax=Phaseolus angularis TaxID=3914 RepID=UPI0022B4CB84|nr:uncharacterized protein LOC128194717 isoform X2 [Vigna angularis]
MISLPTLLVHSQMWILTVVMQICQVEVHKGENCNSNLRQKYIVHLNLSYSTLIKLIMNIEAPVLQKPIFTNHRRRLRACLKEVEKEKGRETIRVSALESIFQMLIYG